MTLYCTECVAEWKLWWVTEHDPEKDDVFGAWNDKQGPPVYPGQAVITAPMAIPVGNGQAAMMPNIRVLCLKHIEVMSPTQQKLLGR